jgi:hypothetical protein
MVEIEVLCEMVYIPLEVGETALGETSWYHYDKNFSFKKYLLFQITMIK